MRLAAVLLLLSGAAACEQDREQEPQPNSQASQADAAEPEIRSPLLLRYKPAQKGGPDASMAALVQGVLDLSGPCVRLQDSSGEFRTVVAPPGSRLRRDFAGLYWAAGRERLRHGSSVIGGGGEIPRLPPGDSLDVAVPQACRAGPAVELAIQGRFDPPDEPEAH